ncbi:MAG: hypothetical protein JSW27_13385 [Phycisphaerales bacterium]|nr:MAG: hypothetical protein JSW27_13385 [Phycisphaerales bacterium]
MAVFAELSNGGDKTESYGDSSMVLGLYQRFYSNFANAACALVYVPSHPARELDEDPKAAGIPKVTKDGKMDFAALRNSYATPAVQARKR